MKTVEIIDAYIRINESCHIIDRGIVDIANIVIGEGIQVEYCFVGSIMSVIPAKTGIQVIPSQNLSPTSSVSPISYHRHITIGAHTTFVGTGIMMDHIEVEIITEVM
jgi:hypothetical protein